MDDLVLETAEAIDDEEAGFATLSVEVLLELTEEAMVEVAVAVVGFGADSGRVEDENIDEEEDKGGLALEEDLCEAIEALMIDGTVEKDRK